MGRPIKIAKTDTVNTGYNNPVGSLNTYGIVGGDIALTPPTISCRVKIGANDEADGYIIRQKGSRKFLVTDGTNTGICMLADLDDDSLLDDTMTVTITKADTSTVRLFRMTAKYGYGFDDNKYLLTFNDADTAPAGSALEIAQVESA